MHVDNDSLKLKHFEQLFKIYFNVLRAYSVRYVYNEHAAEDIVQDVFFELWNRKESIDFEGNMKSYLFKSTYSKSINYLNSKQVKMRIPVDSADSTALLDGYLQAMQNNQEDNLILAEIRHEIETVIDQLPPQCKKVFILSRTYELKNREIAEQLDISVKSVEKHMTKALFQVHDHLRKMKLLIYILLLHFCRFF